MQTINKKWHEHVEPNTNPGAHTSNNEYLTFYPQRACLRNRITSTCPPSPDRAYRSLVPLENTSDLPRRAVAHVRASNQQVLRARRGSGRTTTPVESHRLHHRGRSALSLSTVGACSTSPSLVDVFIMDAMKMLTIPLLITLLQSKI